MGCWIRLHASKTAAQMARILYEETGVGAVAITDCQQLAGLIGIGEDHHLPGTPSPRPTPCRHQSQRGGLCRWQSHPYSCTLHPECKLGSSLVIRCAAREGQVIGTIKLYEPKRKLFSPMNRTLGEGIARLLSGQILPANTTSRNGCWPRGDQAAAGPDQPALSVQRPQHPLGGDPPGSGAGPRPGAAPSTFFRKNLKRQRR